MLIQVNFDPVQEISPKVWGGHSFVSGPFFAKLMYIYFGGIVFVIAKVCNLHVYLVACLEACTQYEFNICEGKLLLATLT